MNFRLYLVKEGARERFGDTDFQTFNCAMDFALQWLPEEADFEIEEVSASEGPSLAKIVTQPTETINQLIDERSNVISLCNYRKVKYGQAI